MAYSAAKGNGREPVGLRCIRWFRVFGATGGQNLGKRQVPEPYSQRRKPLLACGALLHYIYIYINK